MKRQSKLSVCLWCFAAALTILALIAACRMEPSGGGGGVAGGASVTPTPSGGATPGATHPPFHTLAPHLTPAFTPLHTITPRPTLSLHTLAPRPTITARPTLIAPMGTFLMP